MPAGARRPLNSIVRARLEPPANRAPIARLPDAPSMGLRASRPSGLPWILKIPCSPFLVSVIRSPFPVIRSRSRPPSTFTSPVHVLVPRSRPTLLVPRPPVAESPSSPQPGVTNPRTEIDVNPHTASVLHSLILDPREPLFPTLNHEVRRRRTTRRTANLGSQPAALPQATLTSRFQPQGTCQAGATGTASRIARVPKSTSEAQSKSCLGIRTDRERGRLGNRCRSS